MLAMTWWNRPKFQKFDGIICDGSIRSGKTVSMSVGFVLWAMTRFDGAVFAICGKTIESLRRNVIVQLPTWLEGIVTIKERRNENKLLVTVNGRTNSFYLFGGRDESSYTLIQGITLAGVLFDEVALMPRSFVEQALARCSVEGSKFWFNCNPEGPGHWFYTEWVQKAAERHVLHLHFTMDDNLSLSASIKRRYEGMYSGVFYDRYIRGLWVVAEGLVYPIFSEKEHVAHALPECCAHPEKGQGEYYISVDYGTKNPFSAGLWCVSGGEATRIAEYYYDGRKSKRPRTDEEHYAALEKLARHEVWDRGKRVVEAYPIQCVVIDPSAASMIECIRRHGSFSVRAAKNDVIPGIGVTGSLLAAGKLKIHADCKDCIREFGVYSWDEKAKGDQVIKENDHAMDDIRYFCYTVLRRLFRWDDWKQVENVS